MRILVSGSTVTVAFLGKRYPHVLGHLLTPNNGNSVNSLARTGLPLGIDNGTYSGFDEVAFRRLLSRAITHPHVLFVAAPDVVADARGTLALWPYWSDQIHARGLTSAFVLQDGQESLPLPDAIAYFIGGSTAWKLGSAARDLATEAKARGAWLHLGRVNSLRRLRVAWDMGCDSVDGSGYSRFAAVARAKGRRDMLLERHLDYLRELESQPVLFGDT